MAWIKLFSEISKNDVASAGGKGASLGEMTRAGIPVPPGFVLLASAFERFLEETDLNIEIGSILKTVQVDNMETVEHASEQIQALILSKEIPDDICSVILQNYKTLDAEFVAVRSSATAEDSASAAWAGQLDTFLNTTEDTLIENVRRCWASLFTPRAIFYRFEKGMHTEKVSVAVVIQKMVQSEVSGIAFSVHPVTEDRNQMIIEGGFGLGEAIVSGQVTPDSFVVTKEPRAILDKNISNQSEALWRSEKGGNEWHELTEEEGTKPSLSDAQVFELAEIVLGIEKHYNFPCDIEWAFEAGQFFITQSRPITTLSSVQSASDIAIDNEYLEINLNNYDFLWRFGVSYLFISIFYSEGYKNYDFVLTWKDNENITFVSKEERKKLSQIGLQLYTAGFEDYHSRVSSQITNIRAAIDAHLRENLSNYSDSELADKFSECVEIFRSILKDYFFLEYHSTDEVARILTENDSKYDVKKLKQNSEEMVKIKTSLRTLWNFALYPPNLLTKYELEIAKRMQLGDVVGRYRFDELIDVLKRKRDLPKPRHGAIVLGKFSNESELTGEVAEKILERLSAFDASLRELKGQIGNKGFYRGKVKKIEFSFRTDLKTEIGLMQKGEVLVSGSTGPEMILACKKAGAIVTDEGGIITHAAIISRELGIPCIIGTKFATQILKDGDMVEVDAENGIVRKL